MSDLLAQADSIGTSGGAPVRLKDLDLLVGNIIAALIPLGGLALFVMVILAGFKFLTSGGDPKKTSEARSTLTLAIGGIVLLALAYLILMVIQNLTGATLTGFTIYHS